MNNPNVDRTLSLFLTPVAAGFPSPASDYIDKNIDLNEILIKNKIASFLVKAMGDSMVNAGIFSGDILIVDKSINPESNNIVVAIINGEFTVKRLIKDKQKIFLQPENPKYKPIEIGVEDDFKIWGVVTFVIHNPNL
jgi:DNA polymerase V